MLILRPKVFEDARGYFVEMFNVSAFEDATGVSTRFVQDNESSSTFGTIRGIHFQLPPSAQGKLVRVIDGEVFDVAVDLRRSSSTFGGWHGVTLSARDFKQLWIPPGFGHGFMVLTETARVVYKVTAYYDARSDRTVKWDDSQIGIDWPLDDVDVHLSEKDLTAPSLVDADLFE